MRRPPADCLSLTHRGHDALSTLGTKLRILQEILRCSIGCDVMKGQRYLLVVTTAFLCYLLGIHALQTQLGYRGASKQRLRSWTKMASSSKPKAGQAAPVKYRYLRALPCNGFYNQGGVYTEYIRAMRLREEVETENGFVKADRDSLASFFLAPNKINIEECIIDEDGSSCKRVILREIVPVPLRSGAETESALMAAMSTSSAVKRSRAENKADYLANTNGDESDYDPRYPTYAWSGGVLVDRNKGIFDSLSELFPKWLGNAYGGNTLRKVFYDKMKQARGGYESPYHLFLSLLEELCGLKVTGILMEVADSPSEASLSLGAAVMVARINQGEGYSIKDNENSLSGILSEGEMSILDYLDPQTKARKNWVLTATNYRDLVREQRKFSADAKLVDCFLDEALGLHFATDIPIITSKSLYSRVSVDGLLEQRYFVTPKINVVRAPYFEDQRDANKWDANLEKERARPPKKVKLVGEIEDASTFLKMRLSEKRACLRASGLRTLPRPREGPRKVDAIMIPLLDEEVAYEVLRRLGETRGDFELAAKMEDYETRKPAIAKAYNEALAAGKQELAQELIEEFNALSTLRYDPSNPDEDVYATDENGKVTEANFDIEEWYWEQRKRVYGIIAA